MLFYPTAPLRLSARDVPGWDPAPSAGGADEPPEAYAWFHHDRAADTYRHLDAGVRALAAAMRDATRGIGHGATATHGTQQQQGEGEGCAPVDGVIGFSMGGCMAGMLAAALEPHRAIPAPPSSSSSSSADWAALRAANAHRPLAFAVEYSGFAARPADLQWLYAPRLATPTLHYVGALDTVVEEARTRALAERCEGAVVVVHPGGHHVPVAREWVLPLAGFVKKCVEEREAEGEKERERERVEGDHGGGMC